MSLKVCYAASEMVPFAKRGGLADVSAALPAELQRAGYDVRPFLPFYRSIHADRYGLTRVDFAQDVEVSLPHRTLRFCLWTGRLPETELSVYFVDCPEMFHRGELYTQDEDEPLRFALFCRAVLESCQRMGWAPDIIHCNDWHTGWLPLMLRTVYAWDELLQRTRTLMAIHNIGYQGAFHSRWIDEVGLGEWLDRFDAEDTHNGVVNLMRTGVLHADAVSTVSPTYAQEILGSDLGMGLERTLHARQQPVHGVLNGVDYRVWSPDTDSLIPHAYSRARLEGKAKNKQHLLREAGLPEDLRRPLFGVISRLAYQKGFELFEQVLPEFIERTGARWAVLGSGEERYERFFQHLTARYPRHVAFLKAYDEAVAHRIEAAADFFVMPSRYEPCGLNQMFSLRYGTIPIVRRTGGLADTVSLFNPTTGRGTGIVFDQFDAGALRWALNYAVELFDMPERMRQLIANAMACDFSWERQSARYVELYQSIRSA